MITLLGQDTRMRRHKRGERDLHTYSQPSVYGRIYRENGQRRASIYVAGRDDAGIYVSVHAEARNLRDCEVIILAALERRGLRSWADRLMGGAM